MKKRKDGFWWHLIINLAGLGLAVIMILAAESTGAKVISCLFLAVMILMTVGDWQKYSKTEEEMKRESDFMTEHKAFMAEQRRRAEEQLKLNQEWRQERAETEKKQL